MSLFDLCDYMQDITEERRIAERQYRSMKAELVSSRRKINHLEHILRLKKRSIHHLAMRVHQLEKVCIEPPEDPQPMMWTGAAVRAIEETYDSTFGKERPCSTKY